MLDFKNYPSPMVRKAFDIAKKAHKGQKDKAGKDYINHPMSVASSVGKDEIAITVALLHDVVEDTNITFRDLEKQFPKEVIEVLKLVTHRKEEDYMDYVKRCNSNPIAKKVKVADLNHNMDISRIDSITQRDIDRYNEKYLPAYEYLTGDKKRKIVLAGK